MRKITVYDQVALIALAGESMVCYIGLHNVVQLDVFCPFSIVIVLDEPLLAHLSPRILLCPKKPTGTLQMKMTATLLYIKKGKKEN